MRPSLPLASLLAIALLAAPGPAQAAPARNIYPLTQVRAGQRAVAKSVFKGTTVESFHLEIIGVIHKFEGTRSVILARVLDGTVVKRQSGIIAGMSGSPVYLDGKLAGAIALAWSFSKEPIAGITPIEEMLETWQAGTAGKAARPAVTQLPRPLQVSGKRISRVQIGVPSSGREAPGTMTLTPLGGYLQMSGFHRRARGRLAETFGKYGVHLIDAPGGGGVENLRPPLVPGAALGVQLVRGDFDISGLGTVTMVEKGKVLGFGHSMFELGEVDVPMTGGYVYDIMPSLLISNKIMAPTQVIGRIYRDHTAAVAGETGKRAEMLPVVIEVRDKGGAWRRYSLEVIRLKEFMPILVAMSVLSAVDEVRGRTSRGSLKMALDLEFTDRPAVHREELGYSEFDAAEAAVPLVLAPLTVFSDNPLGPLPIKRVRLRLESDDLRRTAAIERVVVPQSRFRAGDTVPLTVTLRPYGKPLVDLSLALPLPADLPRGSVRVVITGGSQATEARSSLGAPKPDPITLDQLLERYRSRHASSELVAQAALPRPSASLLGEELPDLPRGAYNALQAARPTDLRSTLSVLSVAVPTEWEISGRVSLTLQVESELTGAAPPRPPSPPARPEPEPKQDEEQDEEEEPDLFSAADRPGALSVAAGNAPAKAEEKTAPGKAEEEPVKEKEPEKEPKPEKDQKPLTSSLATWVQRTKADFARAKLTDVAVGEDGAVTLALRRERQVPIPADVIWSLAARDGLTYLGTGTDGVIYRAAANGEVSEFCSTGEMNVHALAFDARGNLLAGTSPHGKVFCISPDGQAKVVLDTDRAYVWSLAVASDGTMYAGAGSPARVYAISPDGKGRVLAELPGANVLSLALGSSGDLYAGTSHVGLVYRIASDGTATVVTQVPGATANALALDRDGNLYAASTPGGEVVRAPQEGPPTVYARLEQPDIHALGLWPNGEVIAATGPNGVVLRITGENTWQTIYRPESGIASALAVSGNALYLGSSAPTMLSVFTPSGPVTGRLESAVLDAERPARWGRLSLLADIPEGASVTAETRSGESPDPDDHWGAWVPTARETIQSRPARFLQYRLLLSAKDSTTSPTVREVRVSRLPGNRPPTITLRAPTAHSSVSKKSTVRWEGRDPDQHALIYGVAISSDRGKTWKDLKTDLTETKYEWDTAKTTDGSYLLKVVASDRRSQPWSPESKDDSVPVVVDNTAPTVLVFKSSLEVGTDRRARLRGLASDTLSPIVSVEYRVEEGEWRTLPFAVLDSLVTDWFVTTDALAVGKRKLELRAFDAAGNMGADKVEVTVADAKAEATPEVKPEQGKPPATTTQAAPAPPEPSAPTAPPAEAKP